MSAPERGRSRPFSPSFETPLAEQDRVEQVKRDSRLNGGLAEGLRDHDTADLAWESEQIAKSHGLYLEFDRATAGASKRWMYMVRLGISGGQRVSPEQWRLLHELSERWSVHPDGSTSLRLTTRGNIQFHWLSKEGVLDIVRRTAESGLFSRNACGDNVRSVMACPISGGPDLESLASFDAHAWSQRIAEFFALPDEPFFKIFAVDPESTPSASASAGRFAYSPGLLNRKFKIGVARLLQDDNGAPWIDDCIEVRTQDLGVVPIPEAGEGNRVERVQLLVGGGQGERRGKASASMLAAPLGVVPVADLLPTLEAVVRVQERFGDRAHRHWARLKYLVRAQGADWLRDRVCEIRGGTIERPLPAESLPVLKPHRHLGLERQASGAHAFTMFVENGRLTDRSPNGAIKSAVLDVVESLDVAVTATPNQDLAFVDMEISKAQAVEEILGRHGYGRRRGKAYSALRLGSGACVGLDTCRLAYTESERFEPELIDDLERRGFGETATTLGITGCERQCYRPGTKAIGLVGSGKAQYLIKLSGTEEGNVQGQPLVVAGRVYLTSVAQDRVADVLEVLLTAHRRDRSAGESFGHFIRRLGAERVLQLLQSASTLQDLGRDLHEGRPVEDVPSGPAFDLALSAYRARDGREATVTGGSA